MSDSRTPPMRQTDEASAEGLRLARQAGEAYQRMVRYFIEQVAHAGQTRRNVTIEGPGPHTLRVSVAAPTFARHDKVNGKRYAQAVVAEFGPLDLKAGRES